MFASIRTRFIRTGLAFAIATALLAPATVLADDGVVTITSPKSHQTFKSGAKITVSGTVDTPGAVYVMIDPSWANEFRTNVSGNKFSSSKLSAPKVKKKGSYRIDVNAYDSSGENIAEGTVVITVTP
jgi:hypothetical protein